MINSFISLYVYNHGENGWFSSFQSISTAPSCAPTTAPTIDDPLDPPDAQGDDEADGIPGAARPIGHRGGHHGGQGQHDDGAVKHLSHRFWRAGEGETFQQVVWLIKSDRRGWKKVMNTHTHTHTSTNLNFVLYVVPDAKHNNSEDSLAQKGAKELK